jgi:CDP-glucose 4,6-dehydratase
VDRVSAQTGHPARAAIDPVFWNGRRILLTGHTGFKGAWLALWLQSLGAHLTGFSNGPPTEPSLYELARVGEGMQSVVGDVRDPDAVAAALNAAEPEILIHMAAQSLVRVVVNVTSDKCYENREWEWGYREHEPMGGHDPYASSKGCAELVTDAFRRSFFSDPQGTRLASARAGNAIGGGDWAADRLVPDVMRAALSGETIRVRNPNSVRPWQHVLNPLSGYLLLAQALWASQEYAGAWNFGSVEEDARPVGWIVERIAELWSHELVWEHDSGPHPHEARHLKLDCSKARTRLGWRAGLGLDESLRAVVRWYEALGAGEDMRAFTMGQIAAFQRALSAA